MVILVEVGRKAYLASIVPVIVNAVLNEHQLIVDIVAFVSRGDFPRSRLGEKQRGKILASWVTRKMRTVAQFGIRDADGADSQITEVAEPRSRVGSVMGVGSSLKNVETITTPQTHPGHDYMSGPPGVTEMAAPYESSIVESPPLPLPKDDDLDNTPTGGPQNTYPHASSEGRYRSSSSNAPQAITTDYFPPQPSQEPDPYSASVYSPQDGYNPGNKYNDNSNSGYKSSTVGEPDPSPRFDFNHSSAPAPSRFDPKPTAKAYGNVGNPHDERRNDLYDLPSRTRQPPSQSRNVSGNSNRSGGGGLRVANAANGDSDAGHDDWPQEALMHMNLARGESKSARYDGSGYGNAM